MTTVRDQKRWRCHRCGHRWYGRLDRSPKQCAACRSPYWNRPYQKASVHTEAEATVTLQAARLAHLKRVEAAMVRLCHGTLTHTELAAWRLTYGDGKKTGKALRAETELAQVTAGIPAVVSARVI